MRVRLQALLIALLASPLASVAAADDAAVVTVTFEVAVPATTPPRARICLAGDAGPLGAWNENGVELTKRPDGLYAAQVKLPRGVEVQYKVTRGTWASVEKNADGSELPNRTLTPDGDATVKVRVAAWADRAATRPANSRATSTRTGDVRVHEAFPSKHLGNDRALFVWLPPEYAKEPDRRFPVLYMHDGQNVFDAATSFAGEWEADETAGRLIAEGKVRPVIIVGVANNASRMDEYTMTRDDRRGAGGRGAAYLKFVAEEVKPFIDQTYRTLSGRADTAVAGSSLGGTISLELCRAYPQTFGACAALSPAAWWNGGELFTRFEKDAAWTKDVRFWIDTGTAEGRGDDARQYVNGVRRLESMLKNAGLTAEKDYAVRVVEGAAHNEQAWAKRFDQVLLFLFPRA